LKKSERGKGAGETGGSSKRNLGKKKKKNVKEEKIKQEREQTI